MILPFPKSRVTRGRRKPPLADRPPVLLSYQPRPASTRTSFLPVGPITVTTIARTWADGDERRCRLCDRCWATDGICLVTVNRRVDIEDAELYSTVGFDSVDSAMEG